MFTGYVPHTVIAGQHDLSSREVVIGRMVDNMGSPNCDRRLVEQVAHAGLRVYARVGAVLLLDHARRD